MSVRSTRIVPLPADAAADAIVDFCASTTDLVAFKAALKWFESDDWPAARSRLERALVEATEPSRDADSLVQARDERGRLAARFHKIQLLRAEESARRHEGTARAF